MPNVNPFQKEYMGSGDSATQFSKKYIDKYIQEFNENLERHIRDKDNPHFVTKAQVGLGNVDNTSDEDKPLSRAAREAFQAEREEREEADRLLREQIEAEESSRVEADRELKQEIQTESEARQRADEAITAALNEHTSDKDNPHSVTKEQVGLGNVLDIEQAAKEHIHSGDDILDGTITQEKLHPDIKLSGVDEVFARDVFHNFCYIYAILGIGYWNGGYFYMSQDGRPLDGGGFAEIVENIIDCGGFSIPTLEELLQAVDGGNY